MELLDHTKHTYFYIISLNNKTIMGLNLIPGSQLLAIANGFFIH